MTLSRDRHLSYQEAARLVYRTDTPSIVEINKIDYKLARGLLVGSRAGQWVTADSVAEYLAVKGEQQRLARKTGRTRSSRAVGPRSAARGQEAQSKLPPIYQHTLRDFVAAVLRRRQPERASVRFQLAVLTGQIVLILLPVIALAVALRSLGPPPEQRAVEAWLQREVGDYEIIKWFPSRPAGGSTLRVRVKYEYFTPGRQRILTDRVFLVEDNHVTSVTQTPD